MKTPLLRLFFIAIISLPTFSQAWSQEKFALIDGSAFQNTNGIAKILSIQSQVAAEFKTRYNEIEMMQKKISDLSTLLKNPANQTQARYNEYETLNQDFKSKAENYQQSYNKRYNELITPVYNQVAAVMKQWCQQKGYTSLIDVSKDQSGLFLYFDEQLLKQTTGELIRFINAAVR